MEFRKNLQYILFFFLIAMILHYRLPAQDLRTVSLGGADLVLNHEENHLNFYRLNGNPALMMQYEAVNWLKINSYGNYQHGSLRRVLDPAANRNLLFNAQGYKKLSERQAFYGQVSYDLLKNYSVKNAIDPDPYGDDPLVLMDSTTGDFNYNGPKAQVCYQNQISSRFSLGGEITYGISQGLKDQFTRPRIIHRDFAAGIGMGYRLGRYLLIGTIINYETVQNQTEVTGKQLEAFDPVIKRFRSESVFRVIKGGFNRYTNRDNYSFNLSIQNGGIGREFQQVVQLNYRYGVQKTYDNVDLNKIYDSPWFGRYYNASYQNRWIVPGGKWILGARFSGNYLSSFSRHPDLDIMITEREVRSGCAELGISRNFSIPRPFLLVLQGGYGQTRDSYSDYQSKVYRKVKLTDYIARVGLDVSVDPIHNLLLGYNYGKDDVDAFSPRYLPDYYMWRFSMGISETRQKYQLQFSFEYFVKRAAYDDHEFDGWMVSFSSKILN
ncbi:MAG: hypothetical protein P8184_14425 [Calditrichia bacterium]